MGELSISPPAREPSLFEIGVRFSLGNSNLGEVARDGSAGEHGDVTCAKGGCSCTASSSSCSLSDSGGVEGGGNEAPPHAGSLGVRWLLGGDLVGERGDSQLPELLPRGLRSTKGGTRKMFARLVERGEDV